jgi:uncharacterized protein (TIRG00374 family)
VTPGPPIGRDLGARLERHIEDRIDVERELAEAERRSDAARKVRRGAFWLGVTGVSLYLVAPSLAEVLSSADEVIAISPLWLLAMLGGQIAATACLWDLQRIALQCAGWRPVIASQLAGNALSKVAPGGGALGAALQYRMLVTAGVDGGRAVAGLTAANLLVLVVVLALPVLALPTIIRGGVNRNLAEATVIGLAVFAALFLIATLLFAGDAWIGRLGRGIERVRNRWRRLRSRPAAGGVAERLVAERDRLRAALGPRWRRALAVTTGRWLFDYLTLMAALASVGSQPRPALVLLAFCTAQVLAQIPLTPGGLGFVEAGLTATLTLAGVSPGNAVLATFAYRLFSYWLMLPFGLVGLALQRRVTRPEPAD